jgi:hypothetical protein
VTEAYNIDMTARSMNRPLVIALSASLVTLTAASVAGQTPQPFPRPGAPKPASPAPTAPAPTAPEPPPDRPAQLLPPTTAPTEPPTEATLGVSIYPGAEFLASYDAGRGQRYYLFGTNASFLDIVNYYRNTLKQKGELIYEEPPIHEFDIGRFREETMAFPPSVTVKDYTWGGSAGYLNPKRGATPARFKTIVQIVPATF